VSDGLHLVERAMPSFYFPKLTADNYQTFRRLMNNNMPETFVQWKQLQTSKRDEHCLHWYPYGICIDVEVAPGEFSHYCAATGYGCTQQALDSLAFEKGAQKHHKSITAHIGDHF
jgi:hypothetical protein